MYSHVTLHFEFQRSILQVLCNTVDVEQDLHLHVITPDYSVHIQCAHNIM